MAAGFRWQSRASRSTFPGADPAIEGMPLGEQDLFYPAAERDTDLIVTPLTTGVEVFVQLRSIESPEHHGSGTTRLDDAELRGVEDSANGL